MGLEDLGKKADQKLAQGKEEAAKVEGEFNGLSKTSKYVIYAIAAIAILGIGSCMLRGCGKSAPVAQTQVQQPIPVQQVQPVQPQTVVVQGDSGVGSAVTGAVVGGAIGYAIGSTMSNGERYNGHNWQGPPPAGYTVDPQTHAVTPAKTVATKSMASQPAPVVGKKLNPSEELAKGVDVQAAKADRRNPGDAQVDADRKADAAKAAAVAQKKKDDIRARTASLNKSRATNKKAGGFNTMSKGKK